MDKFEKYTSPDATIYYGDCLTALLDVPDESVDLVFADPPYNIGKRFGEFKDVWPSDSAYAEWCYRWLELCIRKLKPTGSLYVMTSTQAMPYLDLWLRDRLSILSRIVWHYDSSGVQAKKYFGSLYEPILFCVKDPKAYTFNADDIEVEAKTGAVDITIDMKSVNTGYETFNGHIQGEDFLDTAKYPTATFKSTKVSFDGDKPATIEGELTIKGVTKPVTLKVNHFATMPHPMLKKDAIGANASTVIKRSEFNAGKYAPNVGDEVTITVSLEAIQN